MSNRYLNFVRPSSTTELPNLAQPAISGEQARSIYLKEIQEAVNPILIKTCTRFEDKTQPINRTVRLDFSKKDLFICVQNNDIEMLSYMLDTSPNMVHITDEYGWNLLMIACQANSIDAVKELIKRGIDISVRDKAGNSARSLVIKARNLVLADILLNCKLRKPENTLKNTREKVANRKSKDKEKYLCETCNTHFPDKEEHLSSTVHNISASKGKKIPTKFAIPSSNKGYQLMLKVGWDKESGLGPSGSGKKYPVKTVQKQDRKGLGLDKRKRKQQEEVKETMKQMNRKLLDQVHQNSKNMEIQFRRQFY